MGDLKCLIMVLVLGTVNSQSNRTNNTGSVSTSSTTMSPTTLKPTGTVNTSVTIPSAASQNYSSTTTAAASSTVKDDSSQTPRGFLTPTLPPRTTTTVMTTSTLAPANCSICGVQCNNQYEPVCSNLDFKQIPNTLGNIRSLDASNNSIVEISNNSLPYPNLLYLFLSHNHISRFQEGCFDRTQVLEHLDLNYNLITQHTFSTQTVFAGTPSLKELLLRGNMITVLSKKMLDWELLKDLEQLDLSWNRIMHCDNNALINFDQLKNLNLSHNKIARIEVDAIMNNKRLQVLDLSYNKLNRLQGVFSTLKNLNTLYLDYNQIDLLDRELFTDLKNLKLVSLSHNRLTSNPDQFPPMIFYKLSVATLNLGYNNFMEFPTALGGANVTSLDFSGNPLKELHRDSFQLRVQTHLKAFSLNYCPNLERVTLESFLNFTALVNISIANNPKLTKVVAEEEEEPGHLQTLRHVSFRNNSLESVSEFLLPWQQLQYADLRDNPWRCDCNLRWMLRVEVIEPHNESLICAAPPHLAGDHILSVKWEDFACFHELWATITRRQITIGVVSAIIVVLTVIGAVFMYRNKWKLPGLYKKVGKYANMEERHRGESTSCAEPGDIQVSYRDQDETARIDLGNMDIEDLQDDTETLQETEQRTLRLSSTDRDDNEL